MSTNEKGYRMTISNLRISEDVLALPTIQDVAHYYAELSEASKKIELQLEKCKMLLKANVGSTFVIPETKSKVVITEGREKTEIDASALGLNLILTHRTEDLLSVIGITQTALNKLIDGGELVERYKKVTGLTEPIVSYKSLTKQELIEKNL
jgi:hypothetical protein